MATAAASRTYPIDVTTMWQLWTDPEHLGRWFRTSAEEFGPTLAHVDLSEGGAVRFEMVRSTGEVLAISGRIVELDPPRRLSYTWKWDGMDNESLVTITMVGEGQRTRVAIEHSRLVDEADAERHAHGWIGMLAMLDAECVRS